MFSGLIGAVGSVEEVRPVAGGARLVVRCDLGGEPLALGESIAVSGACLTVAAVSNGGFAADVSRETLTRTTLGRARRGTAVNLERALRLTDRLGGHLVMGHVDATTTVVAVRPEASFRIVRFAIPGALAPEIASKGSVAIDGVSLTVAELAADWFDVAAIPTTLAGTTLGERHPGDVVNLETDVLAKYVRRALAGGRTTLEDLLGGSIVATD